MIELLINNWIGLTIGLVVAIILGVTFQCTIFNGKKAGLVFSIILAIVFGIVGAVVQDSFFTKKDGLPTAEQRGEVLSETLKGNWGNTNGGMTQEQIIASQNDKDCPTYDDQIIKLYVQDFGNYVNFSFLYGEKNILFNRQPFQNMNMLKTDNGLIADGLLERTGNFESWYYGWWGVDLTKWTWMSHQYSSLPTYWTESGAWWTYSDLVSVASGFPTYLTSSHWGEINAGEGLLAEAMWQGIRYSGDNISSHFTKFNKIELVGTQATADRDINTFYNYLYQQVKGIGYGKSKIVDCQGLLCIPIPENLRQNFPTSKQFQQQFPDVLYYGVYNCDIAVECHFLKGNQPIEITSDVEEYIEKNKDNDITKVDDVETKQEFSQVKLVFKNKNTSDISNIDFLSNPVNINFYCENLNLEKQISITSAEKILNGLDILLSKDEIWTYSIDSRCLIFESGKLQTLTTKTQHQIDYSYTNNHITFGVGVNLGIVDETIIDTSKTPITISMTKDSKRITFKITNNSQLNKFQYEYMEMGDYSYKIDCDAFEFENSTGIITVSTKNIKHLFEFIISNGSYAFSEVQIARDSSNLNIKPCVSLVSNIDTIKEVNLQFTGYDNKGEVVSGTEIMTINSTDNTRYDYNFEIGQRLTSFKVFVTLNDGTRLVSDLWTNANGQEMLSGLQIWVELTN